MNFAYITGFFDADGSVSLISIHRNEHKSIQISICNNELSILETIRDYLHEETHIKGYICKKKAREAGHSDNFELRYTRNAALKLAKKVFEYSCHPKKKYRLAVVLKYYEEITKRNGKYTCEDLTKKEAFERLFYWRN